MSYSKSFIPNRLTRKIFMEIVLLFTLFGVFVVHVSQTIENYPWYTNGDQDANLVQGAMLRNAGLNPEFFHHPSLGSYILLGESLKFSKLLRLIPCSDFQCLQTEENPLKSLAMAVQMSKYIHVFFVVFLALGIYLIFRNFFGLTWIISFSCVCYLLFNGMWIHTVQIRSEFASAFFAWFGAILLMIWNRGLKSYGFGRSKLWDVSLFFVGIFVALSVASKIQAVQFVPIVFIFLMFRFELDSRYYFVFKDKALTNIFLFGAGYAITLLFIPFLASSSTNYAQLIEYLFLPFNRSALSAHQYIGFKPRPSLFEKVHYFLNQIYHFYWTYGIFILFFGFCFMSFRWKKNLRFSVIAVGMIVVLNYAIFFNSLRYYAWHYLVYVDLYVLLIFAWFFQYWDFKKFYLDKRDWLKKAMVVGVLGWVLISANNNSFQYKDYNSSYRNIASWFYQGVAFCKQCQDFWQEKYGSQENFTLRAGEVDLLIRPYQYFRD